MITKPPGNGQRLELERIRIHTQIAKAWRDNGYTWTNAQIDAAVDAEMARRYPPKTEQLALPGMPGDEVAEAKPKPSAKAVALKTFERKAGTRRTQVYDLLDRAGAHGLTREEMAATLGVKDGGVSQVVRDLLNSREAFEPFERNSKAGLPVGVIVLAKHHRGQA